MSANLGGGSNRRGYLASFDRQGGFGELYFPSDFDERDWLVADTLFKVLTEIVLSRRA